MQLKIQTKPKNLQFFIIFDVQLVVQYPFVSKTLRDIGKPKEERKHCCGMTIQNEGIGYKDLDELFTNPCDLEFIIGASISECFPIFNLQHLINTVFI